MMARTLKAKPRPRFEAFLSVAGLIGIAAIFLPFTHNTSPWDVTGYAASEGEIDPLSLLGVPFLLAIPISVASAMLLLTRTLLQAVSIAAYVFALAAAGVTLYLLALLFIEGGPSDVQGWIVLLALLVAPTTGIAIVIKNARCGLPHGQNAVVAMQAAYVAGVMVPLVLFFADFGWQAGAYVTTVTVALYVAHIAFVSLLTRTAGSPSRSGRLVRGPNAQQLGRH